MTLGPGGQIVMNEAALTVQAQPEAEERRVVVSDQQLLNSQSYATGRSPNERWTEEETENFFRVRTSPRPNLAARSLGGGPKCGPPRGFGRVQTPLCCGVMGWRREKPCVLKRERKPRTPCGQSVGARVCSGVGGPFINAGAVFSS